jgi:heat-inducible transcriptional repressor
MEPLSDRKRQIIRAIIVEYIEGAEPISSDLIASKYDLGVRSATIRNEMAEITDLGYLDQPHTSAGRIPSDSGYRFFVDHLLHQFEVNQSDKRAVREATRDEETLRELVLETTKALSRMTRLMTAAVSVRDAKVRIRNAVVTALDPDRALLILILENGHTENRIIDCPVGLTLEHIGQVNEALMRTVTGLALGEIAKLKVSPLSHPTADTLLQAGVTAIKSSAKDLTRGFFVVEGEEYILSQPEFHREPQALNKIVNSLGNEDALREEMIAPTGTISIGRENNAEPHYPLTFLRQSFKVGDQDAGIICIVGPTRMDYARNVGLLDFTAHSMSDVLTRLFKR